jgi:hypothetical protein
MIETQHLQELWNKRLRAEIWYSCVVTSVIVALAQLVTLEIDRHILGRPFFALRLPHLFVALGCLIVLLHQREKIRVQALQLTIIGLTLSVFFNIWLTQAAFAHSQNPWIPFYGFHVTALMLPILRYGSGIRLNVCLLVALTIEAAAAWSWFHLGSEHLLLLSGYVWNTLLTGLCATILLFVRYWYERTLRGFVELEARAVTAEKTARMFLTLRDRANSPLQTLEIGLALLKRRQSESAILDALQNALKKLIDLHQLFHAGKGEFDWSQSDALPRLERFEER